MKILSLATVLLLALISINERPDFTESKQVDSQQQNRLWADSAEFEITPLLDSLGLLDGYKVFVYTPICEVEQCYTVQLDFYTDAIGNFLSYDTLEGHELTKLDHLPFEEEDYQRLQQILSDPNSVLAAYKKEELVADSRESEIEGFTGATVLEIKRNVIEGAVYSCHTLWHLAHGALVDSLKISTALAFDQALVNKLVAQNQQQVNYFMLEYFDTQDYEQYLPQMLQTIEQGAGYYPKNALEKMPISVLNSEAAQEFFTNHFLELDYFAQVALLRKLDGEVLTEPLKNVLVQSTEERNSLREQLIRELVE